jgi:hypothetical protein
LRFHAKVKSTKYYRFLEPNIKIDNLGDLIAFKSTKIQILKFKPSQTAHGFGFRIWSLLILAPIVYIAYPNRTTLREPWVCILFVFCLLLFGIKSQLPDLQYNDGMIVANCLLCLLSIIKVQVKPSGFTFFYPLIYPSVRLTSIKLPRAK